LEGHFDSVNDGIKGIENDFGDLSFVGDNLASEGQDLLDESFHSSFFDAFDRHPKLRYKLLAENLNGIRAKIFIGLTLPLVYLPVPQHESAPAKIFLPARY
jgi:hypothetical protein